MEEERNKSGVILKPPNFYLVGIVKWWNKKKGYGFIKTDGNLEIFAHCSGINEPHKKYLEEGELVHFRLLMTPRGEKGVDITSLK